MKYLTNYLLIFLPSLRHVLPQLSLAKSHSLAHSLDSLVFGIQLYGTYVVVVSALFHCGDISFQFISLTIMTTDNKVLKACWSNYK